MQEPNRDFFSYANINPATSAAGFHILDSAFQVVVGAPLGGISIHPTKDSEMECRRVFEQLLANLAVRFIHLPVADIGQGIEGALQDIGEFVGVQRCYLLTFRNRYGKVEEVFEWCAPGVQALGPRLTGMPVAAFPWGLEKSVGSTFPQAIKNLSLDELQGDDVAARLLFPVVCGRELLGFFGLDSLRVDKNWSREEVNLFKVVGGMIAHVVGRRRTDEEVRHSQTFESLIARIATALLKEPVETADRGIDYAVKELCRFVGADRCYVFQLLTDVGEMAFTNDWWDLENTVEKLKNWPVGDCPWLTERLQQQETVLIPHVADLPAEAAAERNYWQERGVQSLIIVPLHSAGALIGGMGFESRQPERAWGEKDPQLLRAVAELIGTALERQKAEKIMRLALADAQAGQDRIATILRSVADGLLVADTQGRIVLANRAAGKLLKLSRKQLLERTLVDIAPVLAKPGRQTFDLHSPSGRTLEGRSAQLRRRKGMGGTVVLLRDITREREIERLKSEFVATAAHELRTPLTSIQGFAEILLSKEDLTSEERQDLTAIICEQAESLGEIISDLLDISRIEAGQGMTLRREVCDLRELVRQSMTRLSRAGHPFVVDIPAEAGEVAADRGKLRQVLDNLLGNAVKYSPEGGSVRIAARRLPEGTEIVVEDHGIGMTQEQVDRIFEKFYRGDASDTALPGIGLGMSIVRHIIEAHGGHIDVYSTPGKGTRMRIMLPLDDRRSNLR